MFNSFLQIAIRNFAKRAGYSILNLLGLTIGIASCLLIFKYVAFERSYDNFHPNADRIFRVQESDYQNGRFVVNWATTSPAIGPALKKEFPEVEKTCRLMEYGLMLSNDARHVKSYENRSLAADTSVLSMFQLPLVKGDPATALKGVNKIILSEERARKYFGSENPLGKTLTFRSSGLLRNLEVTGVFKALPPNSHLILDVLFSYATYSDIVAKYGATNDPTETAWEWTDFYTYIELRKGTDRYGFEAKLPAFLARHYNSLPEHKSRNDFITFQLYPISDIHLDSHYRNEAEANGDRDSVTFLFLIAFFIATIAWINYINYTTAHSLERAREVGLRKVLGAFRTDLIRQFLVESLLLNGTALLLALALAWIMGPLFNRLTGRPLHSLPVHYWEIFAGLFVAGSFLSGIYPAFALSRYRPMAVLRGHFKNSEGGQLLRKGLIVGQFAVSFLLIAGTITVYEQVHYMRSQQLGADIDQTLVLRGVQSMKDSTFESIFPAFEREIMQTGGVLSITGSYNVMGQEIGWSGSWQRLDDAAKSNYTLVQLGMDYGFIRNYGLKILSGRAFSKEFANDRRTVLLNKAAVRALGYAKPADAVGAWLHANQRGIDTVRVIGVVEDFHQEGLQKAIRPMALILRTGSAFFYSVRIDAVRTSQTLAAIKKVWDRQFHDDPFDYFFLDEYFDRHYVENRRFGMVFGLFALLAIIIACLGLLGMSAYNVILRTKEIGIRKVLGASAPHLLYILSRDFMLLVVLSFVIAIPATWLVMDDWLRQFAYRIDIGWWIFAVAGVLAFTIALVTVSIQAMRGILANPVESMRTE